MTEETVEALSRQMTRIEAMLTDLHRARLPSTAPMADPSLTRRQAADYLGIHTKTLAHLTAAGDVTGYRDGPRARWKYRITDLDRYRDDHTRHDHHTTHRAPDIDWGM